MTPSNAGRTAIVTGASVGIGKAIAERLVEEGYAVVGCARTPGAAAESLAGLGSNAVGVEADVSSQSSATKLVSDTVSRFGGLDVLVNNAAVYEPSGFLEITEQQWTRTLATNLTGAFLLTQAAVRAMLETGAVARGGARVVNIASSVGLRAKRGSADYNASKAGLVNLTASLAADLGSKGIISTCVAPGWIDTGLEPMLPKLRPEDRERLNPLGRVGTPEEVAHAVAAVCDPRAEFMNGAVISVDGGQIAVSRSP